MNMSTSQKFYGTVKFFSETKGYGFIIPYGNGKDVFFHIKNVKNGKTVPPQKDDHVSYVMVEGKRGEEAGEVEIIA